MISYLDFLECIILRGLNNPVGWAPYGNGLRRYLVTRYGLVKPPCQSKPFNGRCKSGTEAADRASYVLGGAEYRGWALSMCYNHPECAASILTWWEFLISLT
ncbi:unnamed protein product [Tuber melanosporum]|uniref:(Perigord truffle) hypothetical protein n=1 Tax=Tuber melanosporum (strain Mel28) TaxID=656061 RepID=D5GMP4_TUBMM|nr:uncharacterized protein GSTUM_00010865001 [Tuber melanosporum]CAZ85787.1 unnamed protein product [Tuber melanosporum]